MPRYYLHVHNHEDSTDLEGTELADDVAACKEAVVTAGEMLRDDPDKFWNDQDWWVRVDDEASATVCEVRLSGRRRSV